MNHLTENQLNEYLDGELEAGSLPVVETHLAGCAFCCGQLEDLRILAEALKALPEEAPSPALAHSVLNSLPKPKIGLGWKLVLAAQAGMALGLSILILASFQPWANLPPMDVLLAMALPALEIPSIQLPALALPTLELHPSTAQLVFLGFSALLLWGVGNALLLGKRNGVRK